MKVFGRLESNEAYSWSWFITSNQTPSALVTTLIAGLTAYWTDGTHGVGSQYAPGIRLDSFEVITLDATFKETAKLDHTLSFAGTSSDNPLSDKSTMVMKKVTTGLRRNQRGYTHFPAPVEGALTGGLYSGTVRDRFTAASRLLLSAITADSSTAFVHTGATTTKGGVAPYTKTVFSDVTCSNKPGTQRKRMAKVVGVYS